MLAAGWNQLSAKALAGLSRSTGPCGEPPSRERTRRLGDLIVGPLHEPVANAAVRDSDPRLWCSGRTGARLVMGAAWAADSNGPAGAEFTLHFGGPHQG
jgi:hypothetical protein